MSSSGNTVWKQETFMNEDVSKETKVCLGVTKLKPSQLTTEVTAAQSLWEDANSLFSPLKTVKNLGRKQTGK